MRISPGARLFALHVIGLQCIALGVSWYLGLGAWLLVTGVQLLWYVGAMNSLGLAVLGLLGEKPWKWSGKEADVPPPGAPQVFIDWVLNRSRP